MLILNKNLIAVCLVSIALIMLSYAYLKFISTDRSAPMVRKIELQYAADFSNDEVLVGASHNIFIGRVIRKIKTQNLRSGPETQYQIQVIENIKGNLHGEITVDQQGGVVNGILYVVADDSGSNSEKFDSYLLQPGSIYLFATRFNKDQNWYTLNSYPTALKKISSDPNISDQKVRMLAKTDFRVWQLQTTYPNEKLLEADVKHGNTFNSYASMQAKKAAGKPITDDTQVAEPKPALAPTETGSEPRVSTQ